MCACLTEFGRGAARRANNRKCVHADREIAREGQVHSPRLWLIWRARWCAPQSESRTNRCRTLVRRIFHSRPLRVHWRGKTLTGWLWSAEAAAAGSVAFRDAANEPRPQSQFGANFGPAIGSTAAGLAFGYAHAFRTWLAQHSRASNLSLIKSRCQQIGEALSRSGARVSRA